MRVERLHLKLIHVKSKINRGARMVSIFDKSTSHLQPHLLSMFDCMMRNAFVKNRYHPSAPINFTLYMYQFSVESFQPQDRERLHLKLIHVKSKINRGAGMVSIFEKSTSHLQPHVSSMFDCLMRNAFLENRYHPCAPIIFTLYMYQF